MPVNNPAPKWAQQEERKAKPKVAVAANRDIHSSDTALLQLVVMVSQECAATVADGIDKEVPTPPTCTQTQRLGLTAMSEAVGGDSSTTPRERNYQVPIQKSRTLALPTARPLRFAPLFQVKPSRIPPHRPVNK